MLLLVKRWELNIITQLQFGEILMKLTMRVDI